MWKLLCTTHLLWSLVYFKIVKIRNYGTNGNYYFIDECYRMEPLIKDKIEESERYSSRSQMHF